MLERKSRARPDLQFVSGRQSDLQPGRYKGALTWFDDHLGIDGGEEIHPGSAAAGVMGKVEPLGVRKPDEFDGKR
ncbi:hypothetical protein AA0535_0480 [Asaia krungthepensis NRIC 0535]|uniref:Uncharacterized protein n=1 Tax=Asaia krungthepensis NRIC 0535 TaxID=1307925 RepID=A0ABQ0PY15_9PROT|nr:hypothetical protein AA0535_0480 [Asaia krungthepensis NRIC 0535]